MDGLSSSYGATAHSLFGLPIDMPRTGATSSIRAQESRAEVLRRAEIIVWDEASMIPLAALDCLDRLLHDLCRGDRPFGGKILLLGGDFRQILPVLPHAEPAEVVANTILHHYTMRDGTFQKFSLTENMRLSRDARDSATHRDWLLRLGEGSLDGSPDLQAPSISLPSQLCMPDGQPLEALIDWTYPDVRGNADATASGVDVETVAFATVFALSFCARALGSSMCAFFLVLLPAIVFSSHGYRFFLTRASFH